MPRALDIGLGLTSGPVAESTGVDISGIHWVKFGANSYLERFAGLVFGVAAAQNFVASFWLWPQGSLVRRGIVSMNDPTTGTVSWFGVSSNADRTITAHASDTSSGDAITGDPAGGPAAAPGPIHVYVTADKNRVTASERIQVWHNGAKVAESDWDDSSKTFRLDGSPFWCGRIASGTYDQTAWDMWIGAVWFTGGLAQADFDALSVSDFYVAGVAQDLGATGKLPSGARDFGPYCYFDVRSGEDAADFATNKSTFGGAFLLNGTLLEAWG